jgi:iron complex transport system substrate-binding protein
MPYFCAMKNLFPPMVTGLLLWSAFQLISCGQHPAPASVLDRSAALDFGRDPLEVGPVYAKNFSLYQYGEYRILKAWNLWKGSTDTVTYVLYPREQAPPVGFPGAVLVPTPVRRIVCLSTTQVAMLSFLSADSLICGVSDLGYVYDEDVRRMAEQGIVADVGGGARLDLERIAALKPDLILAFGMGDAGDIAPRLAPLGIPVALTAEYLEETPLGRAEWVRFVGTLINRDSLSLSRYLEMAGEYESLQKMNMERENRPLVVAGAPDRGTWYVPGGKSFVAKLIEDAGGRYAFRDSEERGSLALGFEAVFERAQSADVWLDVVFAGDLEAVAALDRRVQPFRAYQNGEVYNYTRRRSPKGGYDIFESGVVQPQLVLKDVIKALFPEEFPDHQFVYYQKLAPRAAVR